MIRSAYLAALSVQTANQHVHADQAAALLIADRSAKKNGPDKSDRRDFFCPDQGFSCCKAKYNICEHNGDHHYESETGDQLQNV